MEPRAAVVVLLEFALAVGIVVGGVYPYLRKEFDRWHRQYMAIQSQHHQAQENDTIIQRLWIEARLNVPGYHIDGRSNDLLLWIDRKRPIIPRQEIGILLPIQKILIDLLMESELGGS